MAERTVFVGYDPSEHEAYEVCRRSLIDRASAPLDIVPLRLKDVGNLYYRPHEIRDGRLWCPISGAPMSTEFALTRFLIPFLAPDRVSLFVDCDFLFRADVHELFDRADPSKAVMVVKHDHRPTETSKMGGQIQTVYPRKNWSSLVLWNGAHPANQRLTLDMVNSLPGRDLHRFCWLQDDEIGSLDPSWNVLVDCAKALHYTLGIPTVRPESSNAAEWWNMLGQAAQ